MEHLIGQNGKLLVCCGLGQKFAALFQAGLFNLPGQLVGMPCDLKIQIIPQERNKLNAQQLPLASMPPFLFDHIAKVLFQVSRQITSASPNRAPTLVAPI